MLYTAFYRLLVWHTPNLSPAERVWHSPNENTPERYEVVIPGGLSDAFAWARKTVAEIGDVWVWSLCAVDSRSGLPREIANETGWVARSNSAREGVK